jgi:membrane protein DedA with SNARE-associated domain
VIESGALLAILGLILVKEAGVPIPVPGDLVVIGAGVAAGRGELDPGVALVAIVLASIVGGVVQYGLLRSVARPALLRLLERFGSAERVDRQTERLRRGGARSVAVARSTPGVRIVAIAAIGLAVIGGAGWALLARRRGRQAALGATSALPAAVAWADACCPACLTLAALDRAR